MKVISDLAPGDVVYLGSTTPSIVIYKSEPEDYSSPYDGHRRKNITIIFYHEGQLKTFRVTTETRLTYMVKYEAQEWRWSGGSELPEEPAG